MAFEFGQIIGPLAQSLLGEPNRAYSSEHELRYGSKGSLSVDLRKGTWFDHEANEGGGALDLVTRETKLKGPERLDWLKSHGFLFETVQTNYASPRPSIVATYDYVDEGGGMLSQVCRFEPKDFKQRRPDGNGGWIWSVKGVRYVPYRLPQVLENDDRVVCIVEGEKDADRLWKIGVPATCNPGGAGKWRDELNEFFRGSDVVIVPDRDPQKKHPKTGEPLFHPDGRPIMPGQDHAVAVAKSLGTIAKRVRILELWKSWPAMPLKGDVSDWISNGGTADQLYALIDKLPVWSPSSSAVETVPLVYPFPIDGEKIPRRQWIVPGLLLRRNVTILVAPPGSGKSLLTLQLALMMSTAMTWNGWKPRCAAKTLVINAEDDNDEMRRRLYAAVEEMKLTATDELRERVAIAEAPGKIIIAKADSRTKTVIATPLVDQLVQTVLDHKFDVLVVDPFAETFEGDENSNSELKWAAVLWREIARRTNAAVMLVHHTRKFGAEAGDMDSARGGGALVGVARIVSTLFAMTEEEAVVYGVTSEERHQYLRFDDAKANLTLVTFAARWFQKKTVRLPNAEDDEPGDDVGVLVPWSPKAIFARITNEMANQMLDIIAAGVLDKDGKPTSDSFTLSRRGRNNKRWAGNVIRGLVECTDREAQKMIDTWLKSGLISEVNTITSTSKGVARKAIVVNNSKRPGTLISEDRM
jgi:AAA domain